MEVLRWLHLAEGILDLFVQLLHFDAFLLAGTFALGAMVINISVHIAVLVPFRLVLGRDHASALSAANHTRVGEAVFLGLWLAATAEECLHAVVFFACNHWLVLTLVPVARALWPLEPSVVERVVEDAVEAAPSQSL